MENLTLSKNFSQLDLYRLMASRLPNMGIVIFDPDLRYLLAEGQALSLLGMTPDSVVGKTLKELTPPSTLTAIERIYRATLTGTAQNTEFRSSSDRYYHLQTYPIYGEDGQVSAGMVVFQDITAERQAELLMEQDHERIENVVRTLKVVAYSLNPKTLQLDYLSSSVDLILGIGPDEIPTRDQPQLQIEYIHPEDRARLQQRLEQYLNEGGSLLNEYRAIRPDGQVRWIQDYAVMITDSQGQHIRSDGLLMDITERKERELALRQSEAELRAILDSASWAILFVDANYIIRDLNRATRERLKLRFGRIPQKGDYLLDYVHNPEDFKERFERTLAGEVSTDRQVLPVRNGTSMVVEVLFYPVQAEDGTVLGVCLVSEDITSRSEVEQALQQSEARYQAIVEDQSEFISRCYPNGTLTYINDAYCRYLNKTREELLGTNILLLVSEEEQRFVMGKFNELSLENPIVSYDLETTVNGEMRWQNWSDRGIFDAAGKLIEIQSVGRDITPQKLAEIALRENEERFRIIANVTQDFLFDWDLQRNTGWLSGKYEQLVGIPSNSPFDLEGWLKRIHEEDRDRLREALRAIMSGDEDTLVEEFRFRRLDKVYINLKAHAVGVRDQTNTPVRILGALIDITEQRQAERNATRLAIEEARVRTLTDFISAFSHDFRTPLSVINTSLYIIPRINETEKLLAHVNKMQSQVELMEKMIEAMVVISRLDADDDLSFRPCDINRMLREVTASLEKRIEQKRLTVQLEQAKQLPLLPGDESYLYQAFWNLMDNAVQYTPEEGSIYLATGIEAQEAIIRITDSGPGIDEVDLPRIFMPLYRGHDHDHRPMGSSGMGLPIAEKIIARHGGRITVESSPQKGTTFRVFLPIPKSVQSSEQ